jgi:hypothetical protein
MIYEREDGSIVSVYGFSDIVKPSKVYYNTEDGVCSTAGKKEFKTWKPRFDLLDFPNAKDPKIPDEDTIVEIRETMKEYGIECEN